MLGLSESCLFAEVAGGVAIAFGGPGGVGVLSGHGGMGMGVSADEGVNSLMI